MSKDDKWVKVPLKTVEKWAILKWNIMLIKFWWKCRERVLDVEKELRIVFGKGVMKVFEGMSKKAFGGFPNMEGLDLLVFASLFCEYLVNKGII